ncbi:MAG TPA: precorrin-6A synthase (deacetylating) [Xanthobacteraceae bacterium]|jgi:precorrin-6A synthase|nr:precorrin-6A synthase (deacetylating) [Xanthobacteraceae bacterium]
MRKVFVIGIGAGNPDYVTVQAINALNTVDVFFFIDKGQEKDDLVRLRKDICERYIKDKSYRILETVDPPRERTPSSYEPVVREWHERRAAIYEKLIVEELGDDERGAFLVWGDPSLYDSTLRIIDQIVERGAVAFDYEVIPGISAVQALAARHRIALNRIGKPVAITTGRRLVENGLPREADDVVIMLDADCAFKTIAEPDIDIYWGAYLGSDDEILVAGKLGEVAGEIERARAAAKARKGWIMDTYLLRKNKEAGETEA